MRRHFRTVIVGGGPAGLAPLVAASRSGRLEALLAEGLAVIERGPSVGAGRLGDYAIRSDSTAETFLSAVRGHADPRLGELTDTAICRRLAARGSEAVPLAEAGDLMQAVGAVLDRAVTDAGGRVLVNHEAASARRACDGTWRVHVHSPANGDSFEISADHLLLATGGEQTRARLRDEPVAGRSLLPEHRDRLMLSDEVLRPQGSAAVRHALRAARVPRVAIVGGSTSALAVAGLLLRSCGDLLTAPGSIAVMHRRPLRVFYPSAAAARQDGYDVFGPDDICPVSGFVYRLAGFRLDSRELLMSILGLGGRRPEPRVVLHDLAARENAEAQRHLADADVVVAALGYCPRALPIFDVDGTEIPLRGRLGREPLVDDVCRIGDRDGRPIVGLFGLGLAAGFVPHGRLGGEPSFRGQANGLWLWQTAVGTLLVEALLATSAADRPRSRDEAVAALSTQPVPA